MAEQTHYNVSIQIKKVTNVPAKVGRPGYVAESSPAERIVEDITTITQKAKSLDDAIDTTIDFLGVVKEATSNE